VEGAIDRGDQVDLLPGWCRLGSGDGRPWLDDSRVHMREGIVGGGGPLGVGDRLRQFLFDLTNQGLLVGFRQESFLDQVLLEGDHGVVATPFVDLLARAVEAVVVVGGVGVVAIGLRLDEAGAFA
jgi:hypothetical protein